jgi:hypothetical protein
MAVSLNHKPLTEFTQWYVDYDPTGGRNGMLDWRGFSEHADEVWRMWQHYKREMDLRVENYDILEKLVDGEVISPKPDLPNISSGETAGLIRRIARNLVQNTPNVEVISRFNDDHLKGIFSRHILTSKIIGSDEYSNDMQQNLFASTKTSLTLGFACVIPVLLQDAAGGWYMKYDTIHYRDVFPEPGTKDVRNCTSVFVRRYLTRGEAVALIMDQAPGWDLDALKLLVQNRPPAREQQSVDHQTKKHHQIPDGYEIITLYTNTGDNFLTFSANTKMLLRIEKNKHPLKQHPVHFLVLEKDDQQPLGKSQVELLIGRQDFQDLMLNGAMKLWYRNINPSIIGYGTVNAVPNLSPGKYTQISNPNAKVEPFEVNTQTLMQYSSISQQNLGSMVSLIGAADQQMAAQTGNGMSATPQGVEAQQAMVDITTNNYQKAIEAFFSHYCSYALTIYFQELKAVKKVHPTAEARIKLLEAGLEPETIAEDGCLYLDFEDMAIEYFVRCVPGSLVEMEDEKQLRILNQLFIPLSQAMPALVATQDQDLTRQAARAMQYIVGKQIELSGATSAKELGLLWQHGDIEQVNERDARINSVEERIDGLTGQAAEELELNTAAIQQLQEQMSLMTQNQQMLLEKLGVMGNGSETGSPTPEEQVAANSNPLPREPSLYSATA